MANLNTIIVDDEEFARSSLYFLLQQNCSNVNICGIAKSVEEARTILQNHQIDLIFLDIAMPGENGFALIPDLKKTNAAVIFTTAYDQYALKAIKANAIDYLLKPIDIDELIAAVDKASQRKVLNIAANRADSLLNLGNDIQGQKTLSKLTLPIGHGYRVVEIADIVHIEADSNYSIFHLKSMEKITVSKVLKDYEELLPEDKFMRIHKSSIVNLNYIKEYHNKNGLILILANGEQTQVSRRRTSDFFERIKNYTQLQSEK